MQKFTCTNCSYLYNPFLGEEDIPPGTSFDDLEEWWGCLQCGGDKDGFMETPVYVQELSNPSSVTEQESSHIPFYREQGNALLVKIGTMDNPHETAENHFIEYVGLFDSDGDVIELKIQPEEEVIVFENPWLDEYEIRLGCNLHGVWRGVKID